MLDAVEAEFLNLDHTKQDAFTYSTTRAPTTSDQGVFWVFRNGTTNQLYIRDTVANVWRGPVSFT